MKKEVRIIICKCNKNRKSFGIRVEKKANDWFRTWSFPISEKVAKNEGYTDEKIKGSFTATEEYKGCPYCKTMFFMVCGNCGKMSCYHGDKRATCQWCENSTEIMMAESFNVSGKNF